MINTDTQTILAPATEPTPPPGEKGRIAGLDELHGLSIFLVMVCHGTSLWTLMPPQFGGYGFHGVALFFVISGYLITRILVESQGKPGYFSTFYLNRIFRILPLMLATLLFSAIIWPEQARMVVFNLLLMNNYAYGIEPMVRTDVMWSLAIEEQFYLVWPAAVFLLGARLLPAAAAVITFLSFSFDAGLIPGGEGIIFKTTHGNMQYIAMGALIAAGGLRYLVGAWTAFVALYAWQQGVSSLVDQFRWIWHGLSMLMALLVYVTIHHRPLIRLAPLAYVGKLCYGIYIIHFFVSSATMQTFGTGVIWQGTFYMVASLVLAYLSFRFFEVPVLNLRRHAIASLRLRVLVFGTIGLIVIIALAALIPTMRHLYTS